MSTDTSAVVDPTAHWSFETRQVHAGQTPDIATKARVQRLRDLGAAPSPFNAFLVAQGLETLSLRVERHVANARRVAEYLQAHPGVVAVNYAGLPGSPWHELGKKPAPKATSAVGVSGVLP